jgi:hypothetical protein
MLWKWETKAGVRGLGTSQWSAQLQHAQSPLGRARRCSVGVSLIYRAHIARRQIGAVQLCGMRCGDLYVLHKKADHCANCPIASVFFDDAQTLQTSTVAHGTRLALAARTHDETHADKPANK